MKAYVSKIILLCLIFSACGVLKPNRTTRFIASSMETRETDLSEMDDKLMQIHLYYVIAQKQLMLFDGEIAETDGLKIYERPVYLKLQAARTQVEELENEIIASAHSDQRILAKISGFGEKSNIHAYSVDNLKSHLSIADDKELKALTKNEIESEISFLSSSTQYQVFEKNIEHLSYMLESSTSETSKNFYPSSSPAGNISGNEFPSKVWSLTFEDGPKAVVSSLIVKELKKHGHAATFFQLTRQALANQAAAKMVRAEGMEIASHSFTHEQLTKVGASRMEKEITGAVKELSKLHGVRIKFFRLPYGSGISNPQIREKLAANGLIHASSNVDTIDWMPQTPQKIVTRTIALMKRTPKDAGIIIFHDIHQRTASALPQIMEYLKQENRRVCTLNQIVTQMNERSKSVCPQK